MTEYKITEEKRYAFTILPNIIDDMGLSAIAYRLYGHLKRVAGEKGECFQSGETLAKACNLSTGAISKAKNELRDAGLIRIEVKNNDRNIYHSITIIDVWAQNMDKYKPSPSEGASLNEGGVSPSEELPSPSETNKNPSKKITSRGKQKADPRTAHPAILCVKGITQKNPPKEIYDEIIEILGETPDGVYLGACRKEWVRRGYNPNAWTWLTDWYKNHGLPNGNGRGKAQTNEVSPAPTTKDEHGGMNL